MICNVQERPPRLNTPMRPKDIPSEHESQRSRMTMQRLAPWRDGCSVGSSQNWAGPSLTGATLSTRSSPFHQWKRSVDTPPSRPLSASLGRSARQRLALYRVGVSDDISADHPLRKLRELGMLVSNDALGKASAIALHLEEVNIPASCQVRRHDVEGRMLTVEGAAVEALPIASCITQYTVCDGSCFFMRLLHEIPPDSNDTRKWVDAHRVPRWKQYATAVALYIALADAGYCDQALPFLSIQWVNWQELLMNHMHLRLDLVSNSVTRHMLQMHCGSDKVEKVPVALALPVTMKGTLRYPYTKGTLPSLSTQPFTDAEVFQLFYLQLVFRFVYDVRFPEMMPDDDETFLRSDFIAAQTSGKQPLAFQHPTSPNHWLLFPARSKILHLMSLEGAVIPGCTSQKRYHETTKQRLFGATPLLPCQGKLGRQVVVEWAMQRVISTPHEAATALEELFDCFGVSYGVEQETVWCASEAPRIFRCGNASLMRLHANNSDLSRFFATALFPISPPVVQERQGVEEEEETPREEPREEKVEKENAIVRRWRQYITDGDISLFDGDTNDIELVQLAGKGGSGVVYEGRYGPQRIPVAVKCLAIPDGMNHETYVKESLTNVAFSVLFNQLQSCGVVRGAYLYDFVISSTPPKGMPEDDVRMCCRGGDGSSHMKLCFIVIELMDGALGRFLTEDDEDFDPVYDTLVNSPLRDGEVFQFLYTQLALRALMDYTIMDLMLNGQLRGDNIGYRRLTRSETDIPGISSYNGIIIVFQSATDASPRYLRFPASTGDADKLGPLRFICFIDLGQGKLPKLQELTRRGLIGESIVESCIQDDGLGRYWPLDRIYSKYVETQGVVARAAVEWGAGLCIDSPEAAEAALQELFELYTPTYGVEKPSTEEIATHVVFVWTPDSVNELRRSYIYRGSDE
ncbi:hypothetical protein DQ04_00051040 [Trypanosoma grayi]|uniref:hypothetical protein n=1 Tax=Trypanosoma grayi TaxID=71804 RepID=UPI0004F42459|nr:hypothetical protein DQ04_00051040 [Trypanosoma grayi]KEG15509.1 hypothetical protein DQ04_00051040 [Trypanosoma grayi]